MRTNGAVVATVAVLGLVAPTSVPGASGEPKPGAESVEALVGRCAADGTIVSVKDPETGRVVDDPKLGTPVFRVPDTRKLRATVRANRALMEPLPSRHALVGCAKLAAPPSVPGWVAVLRAVGLELADPISTQLSYEIAARHRRTPPTRKGRDDLKVLVNLAIEAGSVEYHTSKSGRWAWLTVRDPAKLRALLKERHDLLGPDLVDAAVDLSWSRADHGPILRAIGEALPDPTASAFASEFAARDLAADLKPKDAANELEAAAKGFAAIHDTPSKARVLIALGRARRDLGEDERALANLREARRILERVHDGKHPDVARLLKSTAEVYLDRGEVQRALIEYLDSIRIWMALPKEQQDFAEAADTFRVFAGVNVRMGYPEEAARGQLQNALFLLSEAEALRAAEDTEPVKANCLRDLGRLDLRRGRAADAKKRLDAALDIQIRRDGAVHPNTIETLLALGQACDAGGEYGQAEFFGREAAIFLRHHYGPRHPAVVRAHTARSAQHLARGALRDALGEIDRGLDAARVPAAKTGAAAGAPDYLPIRDTVALLTRKAEVLVRAADHEKDGARQAALLRDAAEGFLAAERVFDVVSERMPGEGDQLLARDDAPEFHTGLLGCYDRLGRIDPPSVPPGAVFATAERATARGLLATLGSDLEARIGGVPEEDRARERLLLLRRDEAMRQFLRLPYENNQTLSPHQAEAWEKQEQAQRDLSENHRLARKGPTGVPPGGPTRCTPEQALDLLGPGEAAVLFVLGGRESFAVVLRREAGGPSVSIHPVPPSGDLDEKVSTLTDPEVLRGSLYRQAAEGLYDALLAPLAERVAGKDLLIVPTGPLCRLPFELLRAPGPDGRASLGETRAIRYAPSLTVLRLLKERDRLGTGRPDRTLWAMAEPLDPAVPEDALDPRPLPPLPGAAAEAATVARALRAEPGAVRAGRDATRAALVKASTDGELKRYRYLHFAVHAATEAYHGPLPGLVLGRTAGDDGYLDVDDVSHLDVNADLVVLSACESGRGRVYNGEGVRGLTGAFLAAGGRAVVCSLWKVDDAEAVRFMAAFYGRLNAGARPAEALRDVRRAAAHGGAPIDWAAFVLVGG